MRCSSVPVSTDNPYTQKRKQVRKHCIPASKCILPYLLKYCIAFLNLYTKSILIYYCTKIRTELLAASHHLHLLRSLLLVIVILLFLRCTLAAARLAEERTNGDAIVGAYLHSNFVSHFWQTLRGPFSAVSKPILQANRTLVRKLSTRSTRFTYMYFCTAQTSIFQQI